MESLYAAISINSTFLYFYRAHATHLVKSVKIQSFFWSLFSFELNTEIYFVNFDPADIYLFKVNNRKTRKRWETCSKLAMKTPERRNWRRSSILIVSFEDIPHLFVVFLLLTMSWACSVQMQENAD